MKKDSLRKMFGGFPGGRCIGREEEWAVLKVLRAKSPYRFYGLRLLNCSSGLEKLCCKTFGRKYALAVSSGTAALHTALFSLNVSPAGGDEVVLPAYAWSADLMAILALNAIPVIAPIDETWGLDANFLEKCLSDRTKAIIAVHMRGGPCAIKRIQEIAVRRNIPVIEDGSQCIGGQIDGKPIGHFGDVSIFSFQYNKLITCGEGGVVLTDDEKIYKKARRFHDLGMLREAGAPDPAGLDAIGSLGLNYRLSELQAAMLAAQMKKMPKILKALVKSYPKALRRLSPLMKKYGLKERPLPLGAKRNHAFLCLTANSEKQISLAVEELTALGVPAVKASRLDPHHFQAWEAFLQRDQRVYRLVTAGENTNILERASFAEIDSQYG
jgi:8-amino-3,8-dideoxy-alpha-D-manno-octulosonate transaminase